MKQILILYFLLLGIPLSYSANCECGTHQNGITTYNTQGDNCCSDQANEYGQYITYVLNEGVWVVDETTVISGQQAQNNCCPPSNSFQP